ncbi:hypothetical protein SCUCBS95973_005409 [Sporothrix curviconia]|uniref:Uncharacterized protein n=1 Tax=Sporothrix curviconia TaxID=1260050 RepID=A0ABP0BWP5_9PEZI
MEFKAKSDVTAKGKLEVYENWYKANEIERLLAERMSIKAKGRAPRRSRAPAAPRKPRARKSTSAIESIKSDATADSSCRTPSNLPPLAHWNTAPVARSSDYPAIRDSPYLVGSLYNTPVPARQQSSYPYHDEASGGSLAIKRDPFGPSPALGTAPPSEAGSAFGAGFTEDDLLQANKLKGIVWPGMDLFDSATPDQKRKRNQRKDVAALDLLKVTSENVTATETVWGPEGNMRKERDIYASPSSAEGSPPSTPPPRKRKSRARPSNSSTLTSVSASIAEGSQGDLPTTKGTGRLPGGLPKSRTARVTASAAGSEDKSKDGTSTTSIEDAVYALAGHNPRSTFNVYYDGSTTTAVDPQTALANGNHDNSFDQAGLHTRPALQQLDPNMSMAENSPYFKHSAPPGHFFDNGSQSPHTSYRSTQQAPYASGYQGMSNNTLNPLCSQPRSGGSIYPQFENPMFSGNTGGTNDGSTASFHGANNRRMGYNNFGIDANSSPFGYNDQRDPNIREGSYTDPSFQGSGRLFEL